GRLAPRSVHATTGGSSTPISPPSSASASSRSRPEGAAIGGSCRARCADTLSAAIVSDETLSTTKLPLPPEGSAALFARLTADEPWTTSSRHVLAGVTQVEIRRGERAIERGSELVLALPDRRLSSKHARLRLVGGRWHVEDVGSKNGVLRN